MQDRYVADVGDFGKYGLLRTLCTNLRLAVLWYLVPNETETNDGRHVGYLQTDPGGPYGRCDPTLFSALQRIIQGDRSVASVEASGIFPDTTRFHGVPLRFERSELPAVRRKKRSDWFEGALSVAAGADVAFLDPDNGLQSKVPQHSKKGPKYAYYADAVALAELKKSLVIYHHLGRQGTAPEQVRRRAGELRQHLPRDYQVSAVRFRRGSARVFFVAAAPNHRSELSKRLKAFGFSDWAQHFATDLPEAASETLQTCALGGGTI